MSMPRLSDKTDTAGSLAGALVAGVLLASLRGLISAEEDGRATTAPAAGVGLGG